LITEAEDLSEAFANARDALKALTTISRQVAAQIISVIQRQVEQRVNRRELERHLRAHGCFLHHHGGKHDIWVNPDTLAQACSEECVRQEGLPPGDRKFFRYCSQFCDNDCRQGGITSIGVKDDWHGTTQSVTRQSLWR